MRKFEIVHPFGVDIVLGDTLHSTSGPLYVFKYERGWLGYREMTVAVYPLGQWLRAREVN